VERRPELAAREKSSPDCRRGGDNESSAACKSLVFLPVSLVLLMMGLDGGPVGVMHLCMMPSSLGCLPRCSDVLLLCD